MVSATRPAWHAELVAHLPVMRRIAVSMLKSSQDADDLVQETVLRALKPTAKFTPGTNLHAWLYVIMRNLFYSKWRNKKRLHTPAIDNLELFLSDVPPSALVRIELLETLQAIDRMPSKERQILKLMGVEESYEDAAQIIKRPVGTVRSRLSRAREKLKAHLETGNGITVR